MTRRSVLVLGLVLLGACQSWSTNPYNPWRDAPPEWATVVIRDARSQDLWNAAETAIERMGLRIAARDPQADTAVSTWENDLSPYSRGSFRRRYHVRAEVWEGAPAGGDRHWRLGVRVEVERNDNIGAPADPRYADWVAAVDDTIRAKRLLSDARMILGRERDPWEE